MSRPLTEVCEQRVNVSERARHQRVVLANRRTQSASDERVSLPSAGCLGHRLAEAACTGKRGWFGAVE